MAPFPLCGGNISNFPRHFLAFQARARLATYSPVVRVAVWPSVPTTHSTCLASIITGVFSHIGNHARSFLPSQSHTLLATTSLPNSNSQEFECSLAAQVGGLGTPISNTSVVLTVAPHIWPLKTAPNSARSFGASSMSPLRFEPARRNKSAWFDTRPDSKILGFLCCRPISEPIFSHGPGSDEMPFLFQKIFLLLHGENQRSVQRYRCHDLWYEHVIKDH